MKAFFRAKQVDEQIEALTHLPDGSPPSTSSDAQLIRELKQVYDHTSYAQHLAHSLQQVEQRLQSQHVRQESVPGDEQQSARSDVPAFHAATYPREKARRAPSKSRPAITTLGSLAAVLCVAALIGSLVFTLHAAQLGKTRTATPSTPLPTAVVTPLPQTPTPPTTSTGKAVTLQNIHMFDVQAGWATTLDAQHILHTNTGVTHWQDVSPVAVTLNPTLAGTDFLSSSTAYVVVNSSGGSWVYQTNNGGQSWQKTPIPDQILGHCQITFLDAQHGWLLVGKGAAAGSEAVDILHTSNGGATWKVVSSSNYTNNSPTALPFGGDKSGISFVNATTGWVTGFSPAPNFAWFYMTHDSGATWQHQAIPLPGDVGEAQISALSPVFFSATTGILPVVFAGTTTRTIVYATQDGGASWQPTTAVSTNVSNQLVNFADATHGWMADNTTATTSNQYIHSTVYRTNDGGQHWTSYTVIFGAGLETLDFASPTQGWAIDTTQTLYGTTDGGQTWTKVTPTTA